MSQKSMSQSSYGAIGGAYEPESIRLQREVDEFTQRLEHEKSQLVIIEEQIRQVQSELAERNSNVSRKKPSQLQEKQTNIKITSYQKNINNERVRLNTTKAFNESQRKEVNLLRKELTSSKNECLRFEKSIKKTKEEAERQNKDYQAISKIAEETNNQIIALQLKHEEEKERFESEIQKYQLKLEGNSEEMISFDEEQKRKEKESKFLLENQEIGDGFSKLVILKRRLNKIIETNKEKRKLMDQYLRNVKVIEDAFDQIKQATGISNIEEIVTTFIKAEEQNYSLFNYVNMLNTEYDLLEESNQEIKQQIQRIVERANYTNQEKLNLEKSLQDEVVILQEEIQRNLNEVDSTKKMFKKVQSSVGAMVEMFKRSKFFLCVAQMQSYSDGITFTENNIVQYLAELEEYISSLITYTAFKREDPNAAISSIPLEKLNKKEFQKKTMQIDPPNGLEINPGAEEAIGCQPDGEIISSKELYAKFMGLVDSKGITWQFQGNRNQNTNLNKEEDEVSLS